MGRKPATYTETRNCSGNPGVVGIEAAFAADYVRFQYVLVNFLAEHLSDTSRVFGGDMQMVVILAVIGQVHLNAVMTNDVSGKALDDIHPERRGITTNRLSDVTGIARETTRRKVLALERMGWLVRKEGYWMLAMDRTDSVVRRAVQGLDSRGIKRGANLFFALSNILKA